MESEKVRTIGAIGIIILAYSLIWMYIEFSMGEINHAGTELMGPNESKTLNLELEGKGTAFYRVDITDFNRSSFESEVIGPNEEIVSERVIETRLSVQYFNFNESGTYKIIVTSLDSEPRSVNLEYGVARNSQILYPGISIVVGIFFIILFFYMSLYGHITAQVAAAKKE